MTEPLSKLKPVALALIIFLSGCTPFRPSPNPVLDDKAGALARNIQSANSHIVTSKGTGWLRIRDGRHVEKTKIAWAAAFPNKLRLTFLLSGHPMATIIATGKKITILSHTGGKKPVTLNSGDPNLKSYVNVPVKLSEMIALLLGRFPVRPYHDAFFAPDDPTLSTVILAKSWQPVRQFLCFNKDGRLNEIRLVSGQEKPIYTLAVSGRSRFADTEIPCKINLAGEAHKQLFLHIKTFRANPEIKASVFRLTAKGS